MIDDRDRIILQALQENARATFAEVGQRAGLAASSVHDRVRRLEQSGAIRGYHASIDPAAMGLHVTAIMAVRPLDPRQEDDIPERIADLAEVVACHSVAGEYNYILIVRVPSPLGLEEFIGRLRERANVQTHTTVVLSTPFEDRAVPSAV